MQHYPGAEYRRVMAESRMWLATTGWHQYVGIAQRGKPEYYTRQATDRLFPQGVDLVSSE